MVWYILLCNAYINWR